MSTVNFTPVDSIPEPPRNRNEGGLYVPMFGWLRANPGKIVKLDGTHHTSAANSINKGRYVGCEPGEFRAVARNTVNGRGDIYITYVGPPANQDFHDRTVAL
jgi:hypothetical protein